MKNKKKYLKLMKKKHRKNRNIRSIWFWFRFFFRFDPHFKWHAVVILFCMPKNFHFGLFICCRNDDDDDQTKSSNSIINIFFGCSNFFTIIIIIHIENINLGGWVGVCVHVCNDPMILQRIKNEQNSMKWNSKRERTFHIRFIDFCFVGPIIMMIVILFSNSEWMNDFFFFVWSILVWNKFFHFESFYETIMEFQNNFISFQKCDHKMNIWSIIRFFFTWLIEYSWLKKFQLINLTWRILTSKNNVFFPKDLGRESFHSILNEKCGKKILHIQCESIQESGSLKHCKVPLFLYIPSV